MRDTISSLVSFVAVLLVVISVGTELHAQTSTPRTPRTSDASPAAARGSNKSQTIVNLNTASAAELQGLPGIGAKTAARIIEYRQKKGTFKKIEELMNVQGIGEKSFLKLKPQLTVGANAAATPAR
jgi:competence protein ComEA